MPEGEPYLSIVVVSRNDDHGGNPLQRTQLCIDSLYGQCNQFCLPVELIIVDWNPPRDRPGLTEVIRWPEDRRFIRTRVITVPPGYHRLLPHAEDLPLFQMIGKNVGIRRANGRFVLATNIDILFSDELFEYLSKQNLRPGRHYRADRFDVDNRIVNESAANPVHRYNRNVMRVNIKPGTFFHAGMGRIGKLADPFFNAILRIGDSGPAQAITSFSVYTAGRVRSVVSRCTFAVLSAISSVKALLHPLDLKIRIFSFNFRIGYRRKILLIGKKLRHPAVKVRIFFNVIAPPGSALKNAVTALLGAIRNTTKLSGSAFGRMRTSCVNAGLALHRELSGIARGMRSAAKGFLALLGSFTGRFSLGSPIPAEKKNSLFMLLELFIYRLKIRSDFGFPYIHLNGCGDFTLMAKKDWDTLGGYHEDPIFSWNVDSLLLIDAYYCGIPEIYLLPPRNIYHVEHSAGSGWTPGKGEQLLFERLKQTGIPYVSWRDCLEYAKRWRDTAKRQELLLEIKRMDYGFPEWELSEICIE